MMGWRCVMKIFLRSGFATFVFCLGLSLLLAPKASGQAAYGTVIGTVTDPTGEAVPNGKVTVTNTGQGVTQTTTTNDSGYFTLSNLTPGNYRLSVEAQGFKTFVQENVTVIVGTSRTVN